MQRVARIWHETWRGQITRDTNGQTTNGRFPIETSKDASTNEESHFLSVKSMPVLRHESLNNSLLEEDG